MGWSHLFSPVCLHVCHGCLFTTVPTCKMYAPPRNGALVCYDVSGGSPICSVACKTGTDFVLNPPLTYYCSAGKWQRYTLPGWDSSGPPMPDCSSKWTQQANWREFIKCCPNYISLGVHVGPLHEKEIFMPMFKWWMIPKFTGTFSPRYPSAPKSSAAILSSIEDGVIFLIRVPSKQSIVLLSQKPFYSQPNLVIRFSLCLFCIPGCKQKQGSHVHLFKVLTMFKEALAGC